MTGRQGEVIVQNHGIFCQLRSKSAITHAVAIEWKERYDAVVVVDCHNCGDRMKMSLPEFYCF